MSDDFFNLGKCSGETRKELELYIQPSSFRPAMYGADKRCPVCNHILRPQVEELMFASVPYRVIKKWMEEQGYKAPTEKTMRRHAEEHCPLRKAAKERAEVAFASRVEELSRNMVDATDALNVIINSFMRKVDEGEDVKVTATNVIRAVEAKHKIEGSAPMRELFSRLYGAVVEGEVVEDDIPVQAEGEPVAPRGLRPALRDAEGEGEVEGLDLSLLRREKLSG